MSAFETSPEIEGVRVIDKALHDVGSREVVSTAEITDVLLDLRLILSKALADIQTD